MFILHKKYLFISVTIITPITYILTETVTEPNVFCLYCQEFPLGSKGVSSQVKKAALISTLLFWSNVLFYMILSDSLTELP